MSAPIVLRRFAVHACVLALALAACTPRGPAPVSDAPGVPAPWPEHYAHSVAALGAPGATRAFQAGPGAQFSTGDVCVVLTLAGDAPVRVSPIAFERDGVPVAHGTLANGRDSVVFEAAAAPRAELGEGALELSVRAEVVAGDPAALELRIATQPEGASFTPWDASDSLTFREWWQGGAAIRDGRQVVRLGAGWATLEPPGPQAPGITRGLGVGALRARAGARERRLDVWIPSAPLAPGTAPGPRPHDVIAAEARRLWRTWLAKSAPLTTGDSLVDAAWRAALVTLVMDHERDGARWVPIGNPFQYRDIWLRDGARVVRALALAGQEELARSDARTLARFQRESGVMLSQRGQLDGTGQALWAFEQASALPPDRELAAELLPAAKRAREWLDRQREEGRRRALEPTGLLPTGDPGDNELVRAPLVGNDAWAIAGCEALARMARRAGDAAEADAATRAAAEHRRDFMAALARFGNGPIPPAWTGAGRDWGNLAAAYPTRVLAPGDPRVLATSARVWGDRAGGLASYGAPDSLHTYLGHDLAMAALLRGDAAPARATLDTLLAHSSSTLGFAEIVHARGGFGANLPPHGTSAAVLVDLVRGLLAMEDRDTLLLAAGAPAAWWGRAQLERAPTPFGRLTLTLERPTPNELRARWRGVRAPVRLRVPDGLVATRASGGVASADGRWITAGPGDGDVRVSVRESEGTR